MSLQGFFHYFDPKLVLISRRFGFGIRSKERRATTTNDSNPLALMKHKPVVPANARYRCGFPGCTKRYVSTDGVRKHARKMHNDWLRSVDVHSVLRDKSVESKPSTYCIMESGDAGEDDHFGLFDSCPAVASPPAPAPPPANVALERHGGGSAVGNFAGFMASCMPPEAIMLSALNSVRPGNPVLDALTMGGQLTLPQAMNLHALLKDNPVAREQWASVAAALLANPPTAAREPPVPTPECFTPLVNPAVPSYDTPLREGSSGGDISPFALDKSNPPPRVFAKPLAERPPAPEPSLLKVEPPASMSGGLLSAVANPAGETKVPAPSMLDAWSKPSSLEQQAAHFDSDSDDRPEEPVDSGADLLDLGDVDCDAFLQTLLCA